MITFEDITAHKQAIEELRESEDKYRTLVESSPYCIHQIDPEGRFMSMNRAGLQMIDEDDEAFIVGVLYLGMVSVEDRERISRLMDRAFAGELAEFEFAAPSKHRFRSNFVPIFNAEGKIDRLLSITQDITEHKGAEGADQ